MTKKKFTKRALLASLMSLILCCSMLIGTTYAWFTDSVSSGTNVIKAGNLDVEVEYVKNTQDDWKALDGATDLFDGLWEPGHTEIVVLKITNAGSLALDYKVALEVFEETVGKNADNEDIKLSDYLEVSTLTVQDNAQADAVLWAAFQNENAIGYGEAVNLNEVVCENFLSADAAHYLIIKVDMPETVGNEANAKKGEEASIDFRVNVLATQSTSEFDSFGNKYDEDAEYPMPVYSVATAAELKAAMEKGGIVKLANDIVMNEKITVPAGSNVVLDMDGKKITIADVSVDPVLTTKYGSSLTITGDGTFDLEDNYFASFIFPCGDVTIENGTFLRDKDGTNYGSFFVGVSGGKGKLVINGGYFDGGYYKENDYFNNCRNLLNCSWGQNIKVYGGTFVAQNPAWGDEGMAHTISTTSTYCQGTFLEGQVWTDTEIPSAFTVTEGTTADGRPTHTVNYNE